MLKGFRNYLHVIYSAQPQYIKAVIGTTNLAVGGHRHDVKSILIHNDYKANLRINDIAILQIIGIFDSKHVNILKLYMKELQEDDPITLSGFGAQEVIQISR